jgi:O-antigen ligase
MNQWQRTAMRWGLYALSACLFLPKGLIWVVFGCLLLIVFARSPLQTWIRFLGHRLALPTLAFIFWLSITFFWSDVKDKQFWTNWINYGLILTVPLFASSFIALTSNTTRIQALYWFIAGSLIATLVLVSHSVVGLNLPKSFQYITIYDGNKAISFQILTATGCGFLLSHALQIKNRSWPLAALALTCLFALLIIEQSRTALMLAVSSLAVALAFSPLKQSVKWVGAALAVTIIAIAVLLSPQLQSRFETAISGLKSTNAGDTKNSVSVRQAMNLHSLRMIKEQPLLGHGLGSWTRTWEQTRNEHGHHSSFTAHNEYLGIAAQTGLIGTLLLLWIFWSMAKHALSQTSFYKSLGLIMTLNWIIASAFNATLRDATFSLPLLFLTALVLSLGTESETSSTPL